MSSKLTAAENPHLHQCQSLIGTLPLESSYIKRIRAHQGWWRAFVLGKEEGSYSDKNGLVRKVCNRLDPKEGVVNFLSEEALQAAIQTLEERQSVGAGIIERSRLFYNLLSSQPLCFNFFGKFMFDLPLGLETLRTWWPELTALRKVMFEYAPEEKFTSDNSAFDVAFEVEIGDKIGIIGFECKYTDSFSPTVYDKAAYQETYKRSIRFLQPYQRFMSAEFNQLFRNELLAESLVQNEKYAFVKTALFCYHGDEKAIATGASFSSMVSKDSFKVITYHDFIQNLQRLDLEWKDREWSMMLWARYCALSLSDAIAGA